MHTRFLWIFSLSVTFKILLIWKEAMNDGVVVSWQQSLHCYFQLCAIFSNSEQKFLLLQIYFFPACFSEDEKSLNYNDVYSIHLKKCNRDKLRVNLKATCLHFTCPLEPPVRSWFHCVWLSSYCDKSGSRYSLQ